MFTRPAITPPKVNRFGWNLGYSRVYCLELALRDFGRDPRRSESGRASGNLVVFCPVNTARLYRFPVSQISRNIHTRRGSERRWILSEKIFENFPEADFFSKKVNFWATVVNDFGLQAAISPKWLQILESHDWLACLRNVCFPFVPLESTQSHSPGLQAAYKKRHSWTSPAVPSSAADIMSQSHSHAAPTT